MKRHFLLATFLILTWSAACAADERAFVPIFNGKDFTGWVIMGNPEGWRVVDGCLRSDGGKGGQWIRTDKVYANFTLRFEWMLSKVGNSGVLIRAGEKNPWNGGFEVQLLAPWTPYRDDLHCTASLYGLVPVQHRPDETTLRWRTMEITCDRKRIVIKVDGQVCTEANMDDVPGLHSKALQGFIGFQDSHTGPGQWVKFRNIYVRDFDREPSYVVKGLTDKDPRVRKQAHDAAIALGPAMIEPLCKLMSENTPMAMSESQRVLFAIAAAASDPNRRQERKVVAEDLSEIIEGPSSPAVREYAIRMLALVGGADKAVPALAEALKKPELFETARCALVRIPGSSATKALITALTNAPKDKKIALAMALGAKRDPLAAPVLLKLLKFDDPKLRAAGVTALGQIATPEAVQAIKKALEDEDARVRKNAGAALIAVADNARARHPEESKALLSLLLEKAETSAQRTAALDGLNRIDPLSLSYTFKALGDPNVNVRQAAYESLAKREVAKALPLVNEELKNSKGYKRGLLLRWLMERDAETALLLSRKAATNDEDRIAQAAALDLLARCAKAEDLILFQTVAEKSTGDVRSAALRGCVAVAKRFMTNGKPAEGERILAKTLKLAEKNEDRRLALEGVADVASPELLPFIRPFLRNAALQTSAGRACLTIAAKLAEEGKRHEAAQLYTEIAVSLPPGGVAEAAFEKARKLGVKENLAAQRGALTRWWVIGPFPNNHGTAAFGKSFFPEKEVDLKRSYRLDGRELSWRKAKARDDLYGIVDLLKAVVNAKNVAAYAFTEIESPTDEDVLIKLGSDDGFEMWVNGKRIGGVKSGRALTVDQDTLHAHMVRGKNRILLKVLQGAGDWKFCVRILDQSGKPLVFGQ